MIVRTMIRLRTGVPWCLGGYVAAVAANVWAGLPFWFTSLLLIPAAVSGAYLCGGVSVKEYDKERDDDDA